MKKILFSALCLTLSLLILGCQDQTEDLPPVGSIGDVFLDPDDVNSYLKKLNAEYPTLTQLRTIGSSSTENRPLYILKITDNPQLAEDEPEILIIGGTHGNEQMSVAFVLKFATQLLENYQHSEAQAVNFIQNYEIHLLPVINPEGLARAERTSYTRVDLNRNFSWAWKKFTRSGSEPFDQDESLALKIDAENRNYNLMIALHTGETCINIPWDYLPSQNTDYTLRQFIEEKLPLYPLFLEQGLDYSRTLQEKGIANFYCIEGYDWYPAYGTMQDWYLAECYTPSFTLELSEHKYSQKKDYHEIDKLWLQHEQAFMDLLKKANCGIRGVIQNEEGQFLDAKISLQKYNEAGNLIAPIYAKTDQQAGDYHLQAPEGLYLLKIESRGYQSFFKNIEINSQKSLEENFVLKKGVVEAKENYNFNSKISWPQETNIVSDLRQE